MTMVFDNPDFTIQVDPARKYVEVVMRGYWDDATMLRYAAALRSLPPILAAGGCRIGEQDTLFDTTGYAVQSQGVLAQLGELAMDPSIGSRRIAVLVSSALITLQARRVAPDYGVFSNRDAALEWLFERDA